MEVLELFPRYVIKGNLAKTLLSSLQVLAKEVLKAPDRSPNASHKLAGQLALQLELGPQQPAVQELCREVILPGCERWIRHVIDRQPPQGRGPWAEGRYGLQMVDLWLNVQRSGDYNPTHTHGGSFSGVIFLQVPPQINSTSFDGQLCLYGPELVLAARRLDYRITRVDLEQARLADQKEHKQHNQVVHLSN